MSFTNDELQAFNTILEQKLNQHRRELERSFDSRLQLLKREIEQRLMQTQKELVRVLSQHLFEQHKQIKAAIDRKDTASPIVSTDEAVLDLSELELHTELPVDELAEAVNQTLDERFSVLNDTLKTSISSVEHQIQTLQNLSTSTQDVYTAQLQPSNSTTINVEDMFTGIERLEHIIESMQVAMTSNFALLSNRLYHHQQLSLERAHSSSQDGSVQNGSNPSKQHSPLSKE